MNRFQLPFLPLLLCAICVVLPACDSSKPPTESPPEIGTVTLKIDFGPEKTAQEIAVVCSPDSTVLSTLKRAQHTDQLKVKSSGSGETAFVKSIGGIENEGAEGHNWIFKVNEQLGNKSSGIFKVKPGDTIVWSFGSPPDELAY